MFFLSSIGRNFIIQNNINIFETTIFIAPEFCVMIFGSIFLKNYPTSPNLGALMETAYLHSFLLVVETGSMSEAARRLDLTPAAIAQQMRALEREFGTSLLARSGRTAQPTVSGHLLVKHAQGVLENIRQIRGCLGIHTEGGQLRVGTINTALHSVFPRMLTRFTEKCPNTNVFLQSGTSDALYTAVQEGALDVAVCLHPAFALGKTFDWFLLRQEPLILLAPRHLAASAPHALLRTEPFIRYDRRLGGGKQAQRYLNAASIQPQERFELSSLLAIAMMVDQGLGVSLVPDIASPLLGSLKLAKITLPIPFDARRFGFLWLRASPRLHLIRNFVESALPRQ